MEFLQGVKGGVRMAGESAKAISLHSIETQMTDTVAMRPRDIFHDDICMRILCNSSHCLITDEVVLESETKMTRVRLHPEP